MKRRTFLPAEPSEAGGHDVLRDRRAEERLSPDDGPDRQLQLGRVGGLDEVAGRPGTQRLQHGVLARVHGQHDDAGGAGRCGPPAPSRPAR